MSRSVLSSFIVILLLVAGSASAQTTLPHRSTPIEIRGQIRLSDGGAPAPNIVVRLENLSGGFVGQFITDRTGKFHFQSLVPGLYRVIIRTVGYKEAERSIDLQRVSSEYVFLQLVRDTPTVPALPPVALVDANVPAAARREFEAGRAAVLNKKFEDGITHLRRAVELYPSFFEAHLLLGTAYMDVRQLEKSEAALRRALEIKPKTVTALFALGELYREQKKYDEAEKVLRNGLELDDRSPQGHFLLGRVYFEKNDLPNAGKQIGQALKLKPDFAEAHLIAGNLYLRARRADYALTEFQEYLRLAPDGEFAQQAREMVKKIKGALAEAKK